MATVLGKGLRPGPSALPGETRGKYVQRSKIGQICGTIQRATHLGLPGFSNAMETLCRCA